MALIIEEKQINKWLAELREKFKVMDLRKSVLPAKQYFFPPYQEIFSYNKESGRLTAVSHQTEQKTLLIFGLKLADLKAMNQLDEIMKKPKPDFFYWQKREEAVLVGLTDVSVEVAPAGDLILEKINARQYQTLALTKKGKELAKSSFFQEIAQPRIKKYPVKKRPLRQMLLDAELLAEAVVWSWGNKIWDELAEKCLGCGICTYVCPLCHCFSIEDKVVLDNIQCSRCRYWDACTLPGFSRVAGEHNFHPTLKERYYNWFYHKFVRAYKEYGQSQCVACGRCSKYCPAKISIEEVLERIVKEYKRVKK